MKYACFRLSPHWHLSFFLLGLHHAGHFIVLNSICSSQALSWSRWPESMFTWLDLLCAQRDQCQHIAKRRPFCTLEDSDLIMVLRHHLGAGVELQLAIGVSRPQRSLEIPMEYYFFFPESRTFPISIHRMEIQVFESFKKKRENTEIRWTSSARGTYSDTRLCLTSSTRGN